MPSSWDDEFDPAWYRTQFADVARGGLDPRVHYERFGRRLGRPGSPSQGPGSLPLPAPASDYGIPYTDYLGTSMHIYPAPAVELRPGDPQAPSAALPLPVDGGDAPRLAGNPDLGLHLHLHYAELLEEMIYWLSRVPFPFHLYVSIGEQVDLAQTRDRFLAALPQARLDLRCFPNRGRDLGPFVAGFGEALLQHEYLAHIHSKRSPHSTVKGDWRRQLLANLLGHENTVRGVFRCFEADRSLGMVFPIYHSSLGRALSWGHNFEVAAALAERLDLPVDAAQLKLFPAGSMFWARSAALRPLLAAGLAFEDFPEERGQLDATLAHGLERLFGEIVYAQGYHVLQTCAQRHYSDPFYDPPTAPGETPAAAQGGF